MKVFALLVGIWAIISSVMALKNDICGLDHSDYGHTCSSVYYHFYWSYNKDTNECVTFYYGGCEGNLNRFNYKEDCEEYCKE